MCSVVPLPGLNPACSFPSISSTAFVMHIMTTLQNALLGIDSNVTLCRSLHCSRIFRSVNMCSVVPLPGLNPACSFPSISSTAFVMHIMTTLQNALLGIDSNVTLCRSLHCSRIFRSVNMCSVVPLPGLNPACSFPSISSTAFVMHIMTTLQNALLGIDSNVTLCRSLHCSRIFRSVNMCSVVPLPGLNPACSFPSISSTAFVMHIMTTLQNTLLGIDSNVTLCRSLHCSRIFRSVNMCSVVPLPGLNPACSFPSISSTAFVMHIMTTLQNALLGIDSNVTLCRSLHCSRIFRSVNMCSVVPLPGLNPACSFPSISSTAFVMHIMTTLQNTLLGIDSNVTHLQFNVAISQIPFFWYLDNVPLCPFPWKLLLFPHVNEQRMENVTSNFSNFSNFIKLCRNRILARRLVALQGLNGIKNFLSSWSVHPHIRSSWAAWWNSGGSSGSGQFSTSEKCSVHLTS